jgi:ADP-ribose pyrophosphatase
LIKPTKVEELMMDARQRYLELTRLRPELFTNPPGAAFYILLRESEINEAEAYMAGRHQRNGTPEEWATVGVVFQDQYLLLVRDAVRYSDGSLGTYIRMIDPDPRFLGVVILPVWQGKVLLIRHFRHATRTWHLEIPRGFGSAEDAEESAKRELAEEIGAPEATFTRLGEMYPDSSAGNSRVALFHAAVTSYGRPETIEGISDVLPTPVAEFEQMISEYVLDDGYLLAAYARAKARDLI